MEGDWLFTLGLENSCLSIIDLDSPTTQLKFIAMLSSCQRKGIRKSTLVCKLKSSLVGNESLAAKIENWNPYSTTGKLYNLNFEQHEVI